MQRDTPVKKTRSFEFYDEFPTLTYVKSDIIVRYVYGKGRAIVSAFPFLVGSIYVPHKTF